jgi:PIN domain nuclease of toxin-antitoxin system
MNLLLDTHSFLWYIKGDPQLSPAAIEFIDTKDNNKFLSLASVWEMGIKISINKLKLSKNLDVFITQNCELNSIKLLNIKLEHINLLSTLPFHHKDPFDRIIITQALFENLPIVSSDNIFDAYNIKRYW